MSRYKSKDYQHLVVRRWLEARSTEMILLREFAEEYGIPEGTLAGWVRRHAGPQYVNSGREWSYGSYI